MQREDRFLEDVLKIFHNSKGSVQNIINKYQHSEHIEETVEDDNIRTQWKPSPKGPFKHASGQYEHHSDAIPYLKKNKSVNDKSLKSVNFNDFTKKSIGEDDVPILKMDK